MSSYFISALEALKPNSEWTVTGDQYSRLVWLDESQTKPTEDEVNAKVIELQNAHPMKLLREERDRLIGQSDWRIVMAKEAGTNIPAAWKTYRQALRDLPSTQDPVLDSNNPIGISSVTWPTEPSS